MKELPNNIRAARKAKGLTMKRLGELIGVSESAISQYETGARQPDNTKLLMLSEELGVTVGYLLGIEKAPAEDGERLGIEEDTKKAPGVSPDAMKIAEVYDSLDDWGKEAVSGIVSIEEKRMKAVKPEIIELRPRVKSIPQLGTSFAAGAGEMDTGNAWTSYTVPEDSPAEFAIKINGDSMEPYLHDGSVALCTRENPRDGDVAALLIDGDFIVKQVCVDYNGMLHLFSLNRERKNLDRHIPRDDIERQIMCFGTVIMDKRVPLPRD